MATRIPLTIVNGQQQQIQSGDTIDPSVLPASSGSDTIAFFMGG